MFYPVQVDVADRSRIEQAIVVLNPSESKRLLAKAVVELPEVKHAYMHGRLAVSTCTTSAFVLEELTGEKIPAYRYCIGMVADGMLTMTLQDDREAARFFYKGERVMEDARTFFDAFEKGDVAIKGANAVDPQGVAGVLAANPQSGTVGALLSRVLVRGAFVIVPVGLEKLIASVPEAAAGWGQLTLSRCMGAPVGLVPVSSALVITEIQALGVLAGVGVRHVAGGGIEGSEGAVVLLLEGYPEKVAKAWELIQGVKGEPALEVPRHQFSS